MGTFEIKLICKLLKLVSVVIIHQKINVPVLIWIPQNISEISLIIFVYSSACQIFRVDTPITSTLRRRRWGGRCKNEMLSDVGGGGLASVLDIQSFFIKENWICATTRHHAQQNVDIYWQEIFLLTLTSDSGAIL